MDRAVRLASDLGLQASLRPAQDAFFGRAGQLLGARQDESALKYELQVQLPYRADSIACASFNLHQDKFGQAFGISLREGRCAHTACVGFGLERLALALYATHGFDRQNWPAISGAPSSP
jgi:seryl-tRNA synthetase